MQGLANFRTNRINPDDSPSGGPAVLATDFNSGGADGSSGTPCLILSLAIWQIIGLIVA